MDIIYNPVFLNHDTGMHPENRKRLESLGNLPVTEVRYDERPLGLIHAREYVEQVRAISAHGGMLGGETMSSPGSFEAAVKAVNATLMAAEKGDFAVVRPPGHHAYPDHASGFCIFNNVAIAAEHLRTQGKRVLIFDFDGHLGDGTNEIFYDSDEVLYWSIHQFPAFPGHGSANEIGIGKGKGFTFSMPLPPHSGDDVFMDAFRSLLPLAKQFQPDVVAISAGFDSHRFDLLLDLRLSVNAFYQVGKVLAAEFGHVFATLEGGYNVEELPLCIENFIDGVNGDKQRHSEQTTDSDVKVWSQYEIDLNILLSQLKPYWKL